MPLTRARWLRLTSGWSRSGGSGARGSRPSQLKSRVGSVRDEGDVEPGRRRTQRQRHGINRWSLMPGPAVYVTDMDAAFAVAGQVRKAAYGTDEPACASTIAAITRLAFPQQLVEISFTAVVNR
jgi:hypothetical protein